MGRDLTDTDAIYRVHFRQQFREGGHMLHTYQGPYDAPQTARAIATRFNRQTANSGRYHYASATVEIANTNWSTLQ